jgi:hypothetical protein
MWGASWNFTSLYKCIRGFVFQNPLIFAKDPRPVFLLLLLWNFEIVEKQSHAGNIFFQRRNFSLKSPIPIYNAPQ